MRPVFSYEIDTQGRATGLHSDPSHEIFYILDGELLFHVDGEDHAARAGETVAIRKGVPHAFLIVSQTAAAAQEYGVTFLGPPPFADDAVRKVSG